MRPEIGRFTIRGLLLANVLIAATAALILYACDGNYATFDPKKYAAAVAVLFGLPAALGWIKGRGSDRRGAFRAAIGLHCALMAIFCIVTPALWAYYILVRRRSMQWFTAWDQFHRTFEPSLAVAALYGLACLLAARPFEDGIRNSSARGPRPACGRDRAGR
jgi:hypothetical protein